MQCHRHPGQSLTRLYLDLQLGACRYLLDAGADVDALGGDLVATPLQWAARCALCAHSIVSVSITTLTITFLARNCLVVTATGTCT